MANGHAKTPLRRPRRRNTAEWLSASPKQRRKKVQEAITRHTGDVFFSVQGAAGDGKTSSERRMNSCLICIDADMLYISEVADTVMVGIQHYGILIRMILIRIESRLPLLRPRRVWYGDH